MSSIFPVLHVLRVKGLTPIDVIVAQTGLPSKRVEELVSGLESDGLARRREGRLAGIQLTPEGRERHLVELADDATTRAAQDELARIDEAFLPVNTKFKALCQEWQVRPDGALNDHTDAVYDQDIVARLEMIHAHVFRDVLDPAARSLPRLGRYGQRLDTALSRLRDGDTTAFARPMSESYHDVWMEIHEDIVLSRGRTRTQDDEHVAS